jgi:hypothetical protein
MRLSQATHVILLAALVAGCSSTGRQAGSIEGSAGGMGMLGSAPTAHEMALKQGMRDLWSDHVVWTRDYIIAATAGSPSAQTALDRLMKNQEDLGAAIVPYYGAQAGSRLTALLKDHIRIAGEVVTAAKAGNQTQLQDADRRWHANADEIATFLSGANSHWRKADLLAMLNEHLTLTTQEATARLKSDWTADRTAFDRIYDQAMMMADQLAEGILMQFPEGAP